MRFLGRLLAVILAILVIIILPLTIWVTGTDLVFSDADTYLDTLARQNLYSELLPALLPAIVQETGQTEISDPDTMTFINIVRNLEEEDWRQIASELTPADWLQAQVEQNTRALFDWLHDREPELNLAFDTASLRERLSGASGQRAVNLILDSWPPCTEEELAELLNAENAQQDGIPFCQPPGEYLASMSEMLANVLRDQARALPDVIPNPGWQNTPSTRAQLAELKLAFRFLQVLVIEFWLLPLALLALIVVSAIRSTKAFTRWNGIVLAVGGIAALIPLVLLLSPALISPAMGATLGTSGAAMGDAPRYAELVFTDLFRALVGQFSMPVLVIAAIVTGTGFVLLIISVIVHAPEPETIVQQSVAQTSDPLDPFAKSGIGKQRT